MPAKERCAGECYYHQGQNFCHFCLNLPAPRKPSGQHTYTREEQERILRRHAREAVGQLAARLVADRDRIEELAIERAMGIGADDYNDASFHKQGPELLREVHEELADGIVYQAIFQWRGGKA